MPGNKIGVVAATAVALGAIIGAGIFVLSGTVISIAGPYAIPAFLIVGIVALSVALNFGVLGSIMPNAKGASYSYVYGAFGSELGFITGILLYFSFATAVSVVSLGFGATLSGLLGSSFSGYSYIFSIALIAAVGLLNLRGIKNAAHTDTMLVITKIMILLIFVAFAIFFAFGTGHFSPSNFLTGGASGSIINNILEASIAIFFAYTGFQTVSTFTSKVSGGAQKAAKAIIAAVVISIVIYVLVIFGLMLLMPASSYGITANPLTSALSAAHAPSWLFILVSIGALIATASATIAMVMAASRVMYQISKDGLLPRIFRKYNKQKDVAANSILATVFIAVIMLFAGNVYIIAAISNFGLLFSYIMSMIALMHFHKRHKTDGARLFLYPYLQIITIAMLMLFMYGLPHEAFVINVILVISLIVIYYALTEVENKRIPRLRLFS
jgi:APA family basic amino acid/polyamine antiporter